MRQNYFIVKSFLLGHFLRFVRVLGSCGESAIGTRLPGWGWTAEFLSLRVKRTGQGVVVGYHQVRLLSLIHCLSPGKCDGFIDGFVEFNLVYIVAQNFFN